MKSKIFSMENHKPLNEIIFDSFIIAGMAALAILGNTLPTDIELFISIKVFLIAFLTQIAFEKGIKKGIGKK